MFYGSDSASQGLSGSAKVGKDSGITTLESPGSETTDSEIVAPASAVNRIICASSTNMVDVADKSVHLVVTSPPYCVGKDYESGLDFDGWFHLMKEVCTEIRRVLVPGGRVCINVAGIGRKPYRPTHFYVIDIMLQLGFLMRGEIIWDKSLSVGTSTAWGSWCSASNPVLRDVHEYVLVFSKDRMNRTRTGENTIERNEFLEYTKSIWRFPTESARKIGHPSPFPLELPKRLIQLYSFSGDLILDPFCGSGTTCVAASKSGRRFLGFDIVPEYCEISLKRLSAIEPA
jgi:DNA modification methylase